MSSASDPLVIVHVVFSSRIAGGEQHCVDLANAQAALGHQVHVVGPARSAVSGALTPAVRYHGLALPLLRGTRLRWLTARLNADICHAHLGPACKAAAVTRGAVRLGTLHVGYKTHHHQALDGLICVNRVQNEALPGFRGLSRVIHNWAPLRAQSQQGGELRRELGLRADQMLVGSVGRLHPSKGMDLLIRAFRKSAPADAVLAILGEGKDLRELTQLADGDPRIRLLGFRPQVEAALSSMDLFVSPSREDAFPLAVLEAMRAGLPIVATATQGPTEMLSGQPATLVPVGDVDALGQALGEQLAQLRPLPSGHPLRRVRYDLSAYDRDRAVDKVLGFYRELMASRVPVRTWAGALGA